jgi:peptidoglycan/LPS O-acetylase OafA/YrhL
MENLLVLPSTQSTREGKQEPSLLSKILTAFSLNENFNSLFNRSKNGLETIDGLRGIALVIALMYHTFTQYIYHAISQNPSSSALQEEYSALSNRQNTFLIYIYQASYVIEMFFVIGGFVIGTMLVKEYMQNIHERWFKRINILKFLLQRWLRFIPSILLTLAVFSWAWSIQPEGATDHNGMEECKTRVWENLLMINNDVHTCMGWTWMFGMEFQLYLLSPIIVHLFMKKFSLGMLVVVAMAGFSMVLEYFRHEELLKGNMAQYWWEAFVQLYFKLYFRWNPYLCGLVAGMIFTTRKNNLQESSLGDEKPEPKPESKVVLYTCYVLAFIAIFGYAQAKYYKHEIPWRLTAVQVFGKSLFGLGFSFIVYRLVTGNLKPLNYVLSSSYWYPLSVLTFTGYLMHPLYRDALPVLNLAYLGIGYQTYIVVGIFNLIVVLPLGLLSYLLVEKPAINLVQQ